RLEFSARSVRRLDRSYSSNCVSSACTWTNPYAYCVYAAQVAVNSGSWVGIDASSDSYSVNANGSAPSIRSGSLWEVKVVPLSDSVLATVLIADVLMALQPTDRPNDAANAAARANEWTKLE